MTIAEVELPLLAEDFEPTIACEWETPCDADAQWMGIPDCGCIWAFCDSHRTEQIRQLERVRYGRAILHCGKCGRADLATDIRWEKL